MNKRPVCSHCGGDDLSLEALVSWDKETNKPDVHEIMDKGHYCADCEGECRLKWIEIAGN